MAEGRESERCRQKNRHTHTYTEKDRDRQTHIQSQRDRERDRQTHIHIQSQRDRQTHIHSQRETERDTDRQTDAQRHLISLTDSGSNFSNSGSLTTLLAAKSGHQGGVRLHVLTLEKGLPAWDLLRCLLRGLSMNWATQLSGPLLLASFLLLKKPYDRRDTPLTQTWWGNRTKRPWSEWWQSFADTPWLRRLRQSIQISPGFDAIPTTKHHQIPTHHSHPYTSSIPATIGSVDNANFTCLLTPPVLNSPRKSALLLPWSNWNSHVKWLPDH